jgi:hypothetical protein
MKIKITFFSFLFLIPIFSFGQNRDTLVSVSHDTMINVGVLRWTREIPNGTEFGFGNTKQSYFLHKSNSQFRKINKLLDDVSAFTVCVLLKADKGHEILDVQFDTTTQNKYFYLTNDSSSIFFIGLVPDDDVTAFEYRVKTDSSSSLSDFHLVLYDRWGAVRYETSEKYHYEDIAWHDLSFWVFTYKDKDGTKKSRMGQLSNNMY